MASFDVGLEEHFCPRPLGFHITEEEKTAHRTHACSAERNSFAPPSSAPLP